MKFERIAELRKRNKLSQRELCEKLGIPQSTYSQWELGQRSVDIEAIIKIASFFKVSTDYLLGVSHLENPPQHDVTAEQAQVIQRITTADDVTCQEVQHFMNYMDYRNENMDKKDAELVGEKKSHFFGT